MAEHNAWAELRDAERTILISLGAAWNRGWQPVELARQVRRNTDAVTFRLGLVAIAADHARRALSTLDRRWSAQLDELELPRVRAGDAWFAEWARREGLTELGPLTPVRGLVRQLTMLGPIQTLIPPPGAGSGDGAVIDLNARIDDPMLNRVRALLAQAESTNFEAEAATFTAKAQELMTRHAIDLAMISARTRSAEHPETRRIAIDEPYVSAKSALLQFVAENSRCRSVFHQGYAMSSVVGFGPDIDATETLFTSLLVQAQVAMQATASSAPAGTRTRSRLFRSSFLMAYAHRVAERLADINAQVVAAAEAETGDSILPVLAARSSAVDAAVREAFPRLRSSAARRGFDPAGWASGRQAADRARLNAGDLARPIPALPSA